MVEYQPITQKVTELPNIMSVPEMMVVVKDEDYYIAINGAWKKIINEKRYIYAESAGTQPPGSAVAELSKTESSDHFSVLDGKIKPKSTIKAKITLSLAIGYTGAITTTGNSVPVRVYLLRNDDSVKDFEMTLQDNDDGNKEVGCVTIIEDLKNGDEISVEIENNDPDSSRNVSYVIDLTIEEI